MPEIEDVEAQKVLKKDHPVSQGTWTGEMIPKDDDFEMHGEGVRTWDDGAVFEGEMIYGVADGKGKITSVEGNVYVGDFCHDQYNGVGTLT